MTNNPYFRHKIIIGFSSLLTILSVLPALSFYTSNQFQPKFKPEFIIDSPWIPPLLTFCFSFLFFYFNIIWINRLYGQNWNKKTRIVVSVLYNFVLIIFLTWVISQFHLNRGESIFSINTIFRPHLMLISTLSLISLLVLFILNLLNESKIMELNNARLREENIRAELDALKSNLNPHFLFNSLSSVTATIRKDRKEESLILIEKMAGVFRYILQTTKNDLTLLKLEASFLQDYIFMLKKRFGSKLEVDFQIDDKYYNYKIPPLALQILVENAVKHNVLSAQRPLKIEISTNDDFVTVSNFRNKKTTTENNNGIGLSNLAKRYQLLVDKEIIIEKTQESFSVKLPVIKV